MKYQILKSDKNGKLCRQKSQDELNYIHHLFSHEQHHLPSYRDSPSAAWLPSKSTVWPGRSNAGNCTAGTWWKGSIQQSITWTVVILPLPYASWLLKRFRSWPPWAFTLRHAGNDKSSFRSKNGLKNGTKSPTLGVFVPCFTERPRLRIHSCWRSLHVCQWSQESAEMAAVATWNL